MPASWLVILFTLLLGLLDLLLALALILLTVGFTCFVTVKAFKDFIESMINDLIKTLLAELQSIIGERQGKVAGYTSTVLYFVKKAYSLVFKLYDLAQTAIFALVVLGAGLLAAGLAGAIVIDTSVLAYVVVVYIL